MKSLLLIMGIFLIKPSVVFAVRDTCPSRPGSMVVNCGVPAYANCESDKKRTAKELSNNLESWKNELNNLPQLNYQCVKELNDLSSIETKIKVLVTAQEATLKELVHSKLENEKLKKSQDDFFKKMKDQINDLEKNLPEISALLNNLIAGNNTTIDIILNDLQNELEASTTTEEANGIEATIEIFKSLKIIDAKASVDGPEAFAQLVQDALNGSDEIKLEAMKKFDPLVLSVLKLTFDSSGNPKDLANLKIHLAEIQNEVNKTLLLQENRIKFLEENLAKDRISLLKASSLSNSKKVECDNLFGRQRYSVPARIEETIININKNNSINCRDYCERKIVVRECT